MVRIALCSGMDRPRTVADVMRTRLGDVEWHNELDVSIPIRNTGIATWMAYIDGLDVRAVKISTPAVMAADTIATADIRGKSRPKLIGI